jgi:hypothetical protein
VHYLLVLVEVTQRFGHLQKATRQK